MSVIHTPRKPELDLRILAFPAVMVSTAMQGGCTCENACLLRVETGNVEFAALFAPKPLGMLISPGANCPSTARLAVLPLGSLPLA